MFNSMSVNRQWASRPADQRFVSLIDLHEAVSAARANSAAKILSSRAITCQPVDGDNFGLQCVGPNGGAVGFTNWSFGQLARLSGAPADYLRSLPAPLAADNINYGLQVKRDISDLGVLVAKSSEGTVLRAATGPNYGRVWNSSISKALINYYGDGVTGQFKVPGEFGKDVAITKDNTTLYASDRDMFVFLCDEKNRIEMPNRRNGKAGSLARGFVVWNSETGAQTLGIATFLFDFVCGNRIIWGMEQASEIRIRHTASAPDRFIEQVAPAIESYANSSTQNITQALANAQAAKIGNEEKVTAFLAKRFTKSEVVGIKAAHMQDEDRPIESIWDAVTGITAYARGIQYQDSRVLLEREAGKIMDLTK